MNLWETVEGIKPLDTTAMEQARERQNQLVKPMGSLGQLEEMSIRIAGITGQVKNSAARRILYLFGGDNGVYAEGISGSPQSFTNLLMSLYGGDMNCAINVLCRQNGVDLRIVDMGVLGELNYTGILNEHLMDGTRNLCAEPAMPRETAIQAIEVGIRYAGQAKGQGYHVIAGGEVGMGNTTTAAAVVMAALGSHDVEAMVGRGAGLTDEAFARKKEVIARALSLHTPLMEDPLDILSKVGGLDIAAMVGLYLGAAYYRLPVVIDGVISIAAALLAAALCPLAKDYMIASHASEEPAYSIAAQRLGLVPILTLGMRLGEGTGCPLAMGILDSALAVMNNMSTFEEVCLESEYRSKLKMK